MHICPHKALDAFRKQEGRLPLPGSAADGDAFLKIFSELNAQRESKAETDERVLRLFASQATGAVAAMDAAVGGVAAQEVMKVRFLRLCVCVCVRVCVCARMRLCARLREQLV